MPENILKQNTARVLRTIQTNELKLTHIAKMMGYTTTSQLHHVISEEGLISTKAIISLIDNLNVNPMFLFLGKGEMFLTDEQEIDSLQKENREWIQRHNEAVKTIMELHEIIKKLEKKNDDLIELSSAALKYHKGETEELKQSKDTKVEVGNKK